MSANLSPYAAKRIVRVQRNVADLASAVAFYCQALDFECIEQQHDNDPVWAQALGLPGARADAVTLRLGAQFVQLLAFSPAGRAYPDGCQSDELGFQHLAIVVADMQAAYAQLQRHAFTPISRDGPQTLPPNTGSVRAFKFRDPDGHPLELIEFPAGIGDHVWQSTQGLFLGIDHSAITVADVAGSVAFYAQLGLHVSAQSLNQGYAQSQLDNVDNALVDVVALQPQCAGPMHVELLHYRQAASAALTLHANHIAADCLVFERAATHGGQGIVHLHDPSGHRIMLEPLHE
ncbi:MAG: VOC family protein [Xanthomonadales bacterium]|nr:VOC family protein [Xanthomonadales bacterium]